jgi:uncharacterized membrane protein
MDALTEALVRALRRLDKIETRLSRLETVQGVSEPEQPAEHEVEQVPEPIRAEQAGVEQFGDLPHQLETRVGLTWINRIGVLTLVLAVAFFFKYAVDNRWIGETGRVVLGVLAGFATLGFAELMWRRGYRIYAQGITGAGISILYLSFYASFGFYHLLGQGLAFLLVASQATCACGFSIGMTGRSLCGAWFLKPWSGA